MDLLPEFLAATIGGALEIELLILIGFCFLLSIKRNLLIVLSYYNQS